LDVLRTGSTEAPETVAQVDPNGVVRLGEGLPESVAAMFRLYFPLCANPGDFAVGHLGQSLDGKIATVNGASHYVTGSRDILHNHRMRALFDAVVVGSQTVRHDDPQLTVRHCPGDNPVRVVIDTERRLSPEFRLFQDDAAKTILICAEDKAGGETRHGSAEILGVPRCASELSPRQLRAALAARGCRRLFVEGGGITISRFLAAKCLDRLQVTVSPMIIGSGRSAITLPEVASLAEGLRPATRRFDFGDDVMFECRFDG
jgi:riboflavin-specific deaminase-like protein